MEKYNIELTSKELQMLKIALITKICSIENFLKIKDLNEDIFFLARFINFIFEFSRKIRKRH